MEKLKAIFTSKPIEVIESESFFRKNFRNLFLGLSILFAAYGIYSIIVISIDYFKIIFDFEAFAIIRHIILYFICLIISVLTYLFIIGALYQRSKLVLQSKDNLIDIVPGILRTLGVIFTVLPFAVGLIGFFSSLLAAIPFFPLGSTISFFFKIPFIQIPEILSGFMVSNFEEYINQLFNQGFALLIISIIIAFFNLAFLYLAAEIYKLVVDFLRK
ncbi:MAG: hypothetical protein LDL38_07495 [Flavobacterium piscis]|nr:hypothetical protein [Flavobacterium piscis]